MLNCLFLFRRVALAEPRLPYAKISPPVGAKSRVLMVKQSLGLQDPAKLAENRLRVDGAITNWLEFVVSGRTCATPRLRQSLTALGFGYGLNEKASP